MAPRLTVASTCNGRILYGCLAANLDQEPSRSNSLLTVDLSSRFHEHNARFAHARDPDRNHDAFAEVLAIVQYSPDGATE